MHRASLGGAGAGAGHGHGHGHGHAPSAASNATPASSSQQATGVASATAIDWAALHMPPPTPAAQPLLSESALSTNLTLHALLREVHTLTLERHANAAFTATLQAQVAALEANLSDSVRMHAQMQAHIQVLEYGLKIERRHNAMLLQQAGKAGGGTLIVHNGGNGEHNTGAADALHSSGVPSPAASPRRVANYHSLPSAFPPGGAAPGGADGVDGSDIDPALFGAYMAAIGGGGGSSGSSALGTHDSRTTLPRSLPAPPAAVPATPKTASLDFSSPAHASAPDSKRGSGNTPLSHATSALPASARRPVDHVQVAPSESGGLSFTYHRGSAAAPPPVQIAASPAASPSPMPSPSPATLLGPSKSLSLTANTFMPPSEEEIEQEINAAKSPPVVQNDRQQQKMAAAAAAAKASTQAQSHESVTFNYQPEEEQGGTAASSSNVSSDAAAPAPTVYNYSSSSPEESSSASARSDAGDVPSGTDDLQLGQTAFNLHDALASAASAQSSGASSATVATDAGSSAGSAAAAVSPVQGHASPSPSSSPSPSASAFTPIVAAASLPTARQWRPKLQLKSHMDSVRSVCFDRNRHASAGAGTGPPPTLLLSGSEDGTAQLWNLAPALTAPSTSASRKAGRAPQPLPLHTYRGHEGMLTTVMLHSALGAFTAGVDGQVVQWALPTGASSGSPVDLYACYGSIDVFARRKLKHADAVWSMDVWLGEESQPETALLITAVANGDICVWHVDAAPEGEREALASAQSQLPVRTMHVPHSSGSESRAIPTCVLFVPSSKGRLLAVACDDGSLSLLDVSTGQLLSHLADPSSDGSASPSPAGAHASASPSRITHMVAHPTQDLIITAHVDHSIRFWDVAQRCRVFVLAAHRGVVSCLALDGSGSQLVSGSHDESLRVWATNERKIKQVLDTHQTHRIKYQEAIHSVSCHPTQAYMASAGGDGIVKLYV